MVAAKNILPPISHQRQLSTTLSVGEETIVKLESLNGSLGPKKKKNIY